MKKPNGTNSVYKTSDGRWVGQIVVGKYANGKLKYKRFSSKKQSVVLEKMREYESNPKQTNNACNTYLSDYMLNYMTTVKKNTLKPSSYSRDMNTYELIKKHIGQYTMGELSSAFIQTYFINKLKDEGYSYSTIHKSYILLNECFRYACDSKTLAENPCRNVKQPSKNTFDQKPIRFLNEDEIKRFETAATALKPNGNPFYLYGLIICLDIYTGLRCGELAALKWKDVDFDNKCITVNKNISTSYVFNSDGSKKKRVVNCEDSTKTDSSNRIVNLNTKSLRILTQLKEKCGDNFDLNNYIATNSSECRAVDTLSNSYTSIAKACNIENPLGIHVLRHTFASLLIRKGVDIKIVSELLGHKDVAFTYNTYVHLLDEQRAKAVEMLDFD